MDVVLTFAAVSLRARRAIERAGGRVFDRKRHGRGPVFVLMPAGAVWYCGRVAFERGRPVAEPLEYEVPMHRLTAYAWPARRGATVLASDCDEWGRRRLWHWRDAECPRRESIEIVDVAEATGWDPGAAVASW